ARGGLTHAMGLCHHATGADAPVPRGSTKIGEYGKAYRGLAAINGRNVRIRIGRPSMATNIAARRAAKASRRKAVVAEKRRAEALETTLPARVRRAADLPIQHCLLSN